MLWLGWIGALAFGTYVFSGAIERQHNPNQTLSGERGEGSAEVALQRNRFGHYVALGEINQATVQFMLDTGATTIAVPGELAQTLGLKRGPPIQVQTANGTARAYLTVLDEVRLGPIVMRDLRATITPGMDGNDVLLGMNFLKHLELTQRGDVLTLKQHADP